MRVKVSLPAVELKRELQARVNRTRAERLSGGFEFDGHRYDTDPASLLNLTAVVAALGIGVPLPKDFVWRTADNISVPHTAESLSALAAALLEYTNAVYARSFALKDRIATEDAPQQVDARGGWPEPRQGKKNR